jgi:hypothetical protein
MNGKIVIGDGLSTKLESAAHLELESIFPFQPEESH